MLTENDTFMKERKKVGTLEISPPLAKQESEIPFKEKFPPFFLQIPFSLALMGEGVGGTLTSSH